MKTRKLGRILGFIASVAAFISVFLSYKNMGFEGYSIFEMSLPQYNEKGALTILALAFIAFLLVYNYKGLLTSAMAIVILVADIFFVIHSSTGTANGADGANILEYVAEDVFTPGVGFISIIVCSIILFIAGVLINKGNEAVGGSSKKDGSENDGDANGGNGAVE